MTSYLLENIELYYYDIESQSIQASELPYILSDLIGKNYSVQEFDIVIKKISSHLKCPEFHLNSILSPLYPDINKNTITLDYVPSNFSQSVRKALPKKYVNKGLSKIVSQVDKLRNNLIFEKGYFDKNMYEDSYPFSVNPHVREYQYKLKEYAHANTRLIMDLYPRYKSDELDRLLIYIPEVNLTQLLQKVLDSNRFYDDSALNYLLLALLLRSESLKHVDDSVLESIKKLIHYPSGYVRNKSLSFLDKINVTHLNPKELFLTRHLSKSSQYNCAFPAQNILSKIEKGKR